MIRKIILALFFLLFSSIEPSYSKELKTIWGFSITIPENYIVEVTDFDLLMSKSRGSNVRYKYNLIEKPKRHYY